MTYNSEEIREEANQKLSNARMKTLILEPFYGDILVQTDFIADYTVKTAATNGLNIIYNPNYVKDLTDEQVTFLILHELYHCLLYHIPRMGNKDKYIWNIAADLIVNYRILKETPSLGLNIQNVQAIKGSLIGGDDLADITTEELYDKLLKQKEEQKRMGRKNSYTLKIGENSEIKVTEDGEFDFDIIQNDGMANEDLEERINQKILTSLLKSKQAGKLDTDLERKFNHITAPKVKWYTYIRRFLSNREDDESSFSTPDRMNIYRGVILPGESQEEKQLEDIVIAIDTSGSITDNDIGRAVFHLKQLCDQYNLQGHLIYWDTEVRQAVKIKRYSDIIKTTVKGGGGTNVMPVFEYIKKNLPKTICTVVITDGYLLEYPKSIMKNVVWAILPGGNTSVSTFGKVMQI